MRKAVKAKICGFTLSELLIALAILGVIATFTIPKVLQSQQDGQRKAVFREIISTLSDITYQGVIKGQLDDDNVIAHFRTYSNHVRWCNTASSGCWSHANNAFAGQESEAGMVLHNGATIAGLADGGNTGYEHFNLDWNGASGPNSEGVDQISLRIVYDTGGGKPGTIIAKPDNPASVTLYNEIFAN